MVVKQINPHISVDCVIFGFDRSKLKVLLIERDRTDGNGQLLTDLKLPGNFITDQEDLDQAAVRILEELTGLRELYLQQFAVFGSPDRISDSVDINWLRDTTGMEIRRVVTTAYYSLIRIDKSKRDLVIKNRARWEDLSSIKELAFDHNVIIRYGLEAIRKEIRFMPVVLELLPARFTIRQLQALYEEILGVNLDNRNFRKKVLKSEFLKQLNIKQKGVAHKPAYYYKINKEHWKKAQTDMTEFAF